MSITVTITIDGTTHQVPGGITVIQALWTLGKPQLHGIGCLGGACGACPISTILPNQFRNQCSLACQTLVAEGLSVTFLPGDASKKAIALLPTSSADTQGGKSLLQSYPETRRCVACGACSSVCPQGIDVMGGVRNAINGQLSEVAEKMTSCVSCGLCASVCSARIRPHRVGLYARRLHGAFYGQEAADLQARIESIGAGQYASEWEAAFRSIGTKLKVDEEPKVEKECREEVVHECV